MHTIHQPTYVYLVDGRRGLLVACGPDHASILFADGTWVQVDPSKIDSQSL